MDLKKAAHDLTDTAKDKAGNLMEQGKGKLGELKGKGVDAVKEKGREALDKSKDKLGDMKGKGAEAAKDKVADTKNLASEKADKYQHNFKSKSQGFVGKNIEKFQALSILRQFYILMGLVLLLAAALGSLGSLIVFLLSIGLLFMGISGMPCFHRWLANCSWNKDKSGLSLIHI